jgi:hypothetical protein
MNADEGRVADPSTHSTGGAPLLAHSAKGSDGDVPTAVGRGV